MELIALLQFTSTLGAGAPAPVWLIVEQPAASGDSTGGWSLLTISLVTLVLMLLGLSAWTSARRRIGRALVRPEELAFQALTRRRRVGRRGRRALRRLAALLDDTPPAALLLSERAYRLALGRAPSAGLEVDPAALARIERRIFSA